VTDDPGSVGFETVREILVCRACSEELAERRSAERGPPALRLAA
jgi:hypothetical protein